MSLEGFSFDMFIWVLFTHNNAIFFLISIGELILVLKMQALNRLVKIQYLFENKAYALKQFV